MSERVQWEYQARKAEGDLLSALRVLGDDGWELVMLMQHPVEGPLMICKRPKSLIEVVSTLPPITL